MPKKKISTLKELRESQKLSQAAFAETIGVSGVSVSAYETGRMNPSAKVLQKIQEVYGINLTPKAPKKAAKKEKPLKKESKKAKAGGASKARKQAQLFIQSPMGGSITPDEILEKVGPADQIYVRVDENKAYWVKGEESGSVELW